MTIGSLFAGIGGFDLGLERAGLTVKWQVEIDPFCRAVLAKHWPHVRRYEDVRKVHGSHYWQCPLRDDCLAPVDVLCGGFPCQDISEAGKRAGIDGERSGLWAEFVRLIREVQPRFVIVENVPALLTRGMGRVLGDLASLGFDAEWDVWGADDFGASQHRERIWILAYPHDAGFQGPIWAGQSRAPRQEWPAAHCEPLRSVGGYWPPGPGAVDDIPRMADGPADRMDRLKGLGNAVVPQITEWIGRRLIEAQSG